MVVQPFRHPLTALRAGLRLTGEKYLDRLDDTHHALGFGRMSKRREKVSRWESGVHAPDRPARLSIAHLHGIPSEAVDELGWPGFLLLAFPGDQPVLCSPWTAAGTVTSAAAAARGGSMDRRGFLISTGAALASVAAHWNDALADLPLSQDSGRRLTASMVTRLEQRLDDLRHLDDVLSSAELRPSAVAEYNLLSRLAQRATYDGAVGRRLFSNLAEASRMCGWLYFDAGLNATVQRFYITSLRASASAGDHEAGANTLNFMTSQTYTVGNPQDAVNLIRTAQEKISGRTTARVRARLHARAARALSKTGELKSCAHELDAARDAYATGPHDDDPPWAYSLTAGEIEMTAGSCALDLKDPGRALAHFTAAQASEFATTGNVRDSLLYLTRAAQAHLALGDLDATCATATEVFNENNAVGSSRPSDALSSLRDQLITHRDVGVVRDFLNLSA